MYLRSLVSQYRYWPRGLRKEYFDRWYKELSPSKDLLKSYKTNKIDFESFERLFLQEIEKSNVTEICKEIVNEIIKGNNVTFLCYEKDELNCHRKLIKNICKRELVKIKSK